MALMVARQVPTASTMAVPHGPAGVGMARRRMRKELLAYGADESIVDDAVLILSELLSNSARHARPLDDGENVQASWTQDTSGELTIAVTDGGGATVPRPSTPSVSARGGRGLAIITNLACDWGVEDGRPNRSRRARRGHQERHSGERRREHLRMAGSSDPAAVTVWATLPSREEFRQDIGPDLARLDRELDLDEIA
ncbi:ATP-binding protein [Streptomyces sp. NPDC005438]|uniref:ATP-binding protein n=1 Tax=Streptomyces sp. NPDC005438 TaxID=3156880 RepID=UPI0033AF70BE